MIKKIAVYIAFIALVYGTDGQVPAVFALTSDSSVSDPNFASFNADIGVSNYPDSLSFEYFSNSNGDIDNPVIVIGTSTILSYTVVGAFTSPQQYFKCSNTDVYTGLLDEAANSFTASTISAVTYRSDIPYHCTGDLIVNDRSNPMYIAIQYVPYDTRKSPSGASTSPLFVQDAGNLTFEGYVILVFVFIGFIGYLWNKVHKKPYQ